MHTHAKTENSKFSLEQKYDAENGVVLISGVQALVRALQTRKKLDQQAGLDSGGFVSGYRGSPLGGLDKELWANESRLQTLGIHFQPGVNEDLAAAAVWGSQQVGLHEGAQVEGAYAMWYGKAPGLDRSCDAIRHANNWGTSATGGVLLVVGDDPAAKSSSLSSQSEFTLQDLQVPILAPSNVQEVLDYSVLGWEMSRRSGLWVGLKAIADHMDSAATISVDLDRYTALQEHTAVASDELSDHAYIRRIDTPAEQDRRMHEIKLPQAIAFARSANINRWVTRIDAPIARVVEKASVGIITTGKNYQDVREAFAQLGLNTDKELRESGIEILKLGMPWPLDDMLVKEFADSVENVLVVEEKRRFVEPLVKDALYGHSSVPVHGKKSAEGELLFSESGVLDTNALLLALARFLPVDVASSAFVQRIQANASTRINIDAPARKERTPLFCAGCPHNTSTKVPQGSRATAGIGCHYMVQWMDRDTDSCTHMGGEGVTWVGESPFVDEKHIFANLGDGTYFHSGILAIRQAVAANINITYKVLFNDAVAMTGGQPTDGELSVAKLVHQVQAEGVQQVVIVSDTPDIHADLQHAGIEVHPRESLDDVQKQMRTRSGVTVLIYQQTCATELRRRRKRGLVEDIKPRVIINPDVCDGCGDCTVQSNCVAVEPIETDLGLKRSINQTTCNKDLSCTTGFCPAFVEVAGNLSKPDAVSLDLQKLHDQLPLPATKAAADVLITGVGGTGIVTLSSLLSAAAKIDGKHVLTLDMTGLAQKGGAVFAHVRVSDRPLFSPRIPDASADVLVGCDLVSAASNEALELFTNTTQAVVNTHISPTAEFVLNQSHDVQLRRRLTRVKKLTGEFRSFAAEDHIEKVLGDTQQANVMLLGFAFQLGNVGVSLAAIEEAIAINGVAVRRNLLAFNLGRLAAHDLDAVQTMVSPSPDLVVAQSRGTQSRGKGMTSADQSLAALMDMHSSHLINYQDEALAAKYVAMVERVLAVEQSIRPRSEQLARAVALSYRKLLMVKDEFEVARLHTSDRFRTSVATQFESASVNYLLAPPLLGDKKRRFGSWMTAIFRCLAAAKPIRNTILDPFRYTSERKTNLQLIGRFEEVVDRLLAGLNVQNLSIAIQIARLPLEMRGFGHVKARQIKVALDKERKLMAEYSRPAQPVKLFDPSRSEAA